MANTRPFSAVSAATATATVSAASAAVSAASSTAAHSARPGSPGPAHRPARPVRHRLRAVEPDEVAPGGGWGPVGVVDVPEFLPPGATWLPVPQRHVPSLPGRPPMLGYLVLVPADQHPTTAPAAAGLTPAGAFGGTTRGSGTGPARSQARPGGTGPGETGPGGTGPGETGPGGTGPVWIDAPERIASVNGRALDLTYLEFELLAHLVARPHRVHTRDQLVTTVWGYGHVGDGRTVDVHVARLRRKLGAEHRHTIQTVRRVGYKYAP
ncbi:winged helix-turn-helix domain-containing protein [Streptomyces sp. NPDC004726]